MTKLTIPIGVALLASVTTANADIYTYSCNDGKKIASLVINEAKHTLEWQGRIYEGVTNANEDEIRCAKAGWHIKNNGHPFNFCTATQGVAGVEDMEGHVKIECQFQSVAVDTPVSPPKPPATDAVADWLGKWQRQQKAVADSKEDAPPPAPTEELSCNSNTVKQILYDGTLGKMLGYVEQYKGRGNPNSPAGVALEEVSHWRGTVANIRETDRTPGSISCAAEFEWQNLPSKQSLGMVGMILLTEGIKDPSCIKVNYKVQPLLDKPGQIYVSWRCNDG